MYLRFTFVLSTISIQMTQCLNLEHYLFYTEIFPFVVTSRQDLTLTQPPNLWVLRAILTG
jgi:hypothetical protein